MKINKFKLKKKSEFLVVRLPISIFSLTWKLSSKGSF